MGVTNTGQKTRTRIPSRVVHARVVKGQVTTGDVSFTGTFMVGRGEDCDLQFVDDSVAPHHLQVLYDGILWWVRDVSSTRGSYVNGAPFQVMPLSEPVEIELGKGGPLLSLTVVLTHPSAMEEPPSGTENFKSETQIIQRYFGSSGDRPAGKETLMFRRAFGRVQKKSSRRYRFIIGVALLVLLGAGSVIVYQAKKIHALRTTAERLFYTAKSVELQIAKLEEIVLLDADPKQVAELMERRAKLKQMEKEYDAFVNELGVYSQVSESEKVILHVARIFGECEVNVPKGFVAEVERYAQRWKSTDRFAQSLLKAKQKGYASAIARIFTERNLPPQYLYLALQESAFNDRAVGPATRYGYAKGMWQFIASTGHRYGLRIGPLSDQPVYDPQDERFQWEKAAVAAAKYLKDLHTSEAQGSGLLAMTSYNWGEEKVRKIIRELPENPQERNFWRLLRDRRVPAETYGYVLAIFAATVICENPRLFGFDGECPVGIGSAGGLGNGSTP